jgi:hypothetical protein
VGIGTTSSATKLDVVGTIRSTNQTVPTSGVGLELLYDVGNNQATILAYDRSGNTAKTLVLGGSGNAVYILPNGFMGVGSSPGYKLDVAGDCNLSAGSVYRINGVPISTGGGGGITTQNNVTGSRSLGATYQNTTGKPMFVQVTAVFLVGGYVQMKTDSSSTPSVLVGSFTNASASATVTGTVSGWVLPGNYYSTPTASYQSVTSWIEWS